MCAGRVKETAAFIIPKIVETVLHDILCRFQIELMSRYLVGIETGYCYLHVIIQKTRDVRPTLIVGVKDPLTLLVGACQQEVQRFQCTASYIITAEKLVCLKICRNHHPVLGAVFVCVNKWCGRGVP